MVRGTTARFKFTLPYMKSELQWVTIKFWQPGNVGTTRAPLPIIKELLEILFSLLSSSNRTILPHLTSILGIELSYGEAQTEKDSFLHAC